MSHSLLSAGPSTHLKIVVVALAAAILLVVGAIAAHVNTTRSLAGMQASSPVVQAAMPVNYTGRSGIAIR
jgi:hypothetical protein